MLLGKGFRDGKSRDELVGLTCKTCELVIRPANTCHPYVLRGMLHFPIMPHRARIE